MKKEVIQQLITDFEAYAKHTADGLEFWLARDLQHLLGYDKWDNFKSVIDKAKIACEGARHKALDYFADARKMVKALKQQDTDHFVSITKKVKIPFCRRRENDKNA